MKTLLATLAALAIVGCANPGIVQLAPDTYMLAKTDHAGVFGNASALKAEVIQEANAFAASKGKVAVAVSSNETPAGPGRFASYEYQFMVLDKNDPQATRVRLTPPPTLVKETVIDSRQPAASPPSKDMYAELLKLDDLHKRGVLTDSEFEVQKRRLLTQ